MVLTMAPATTVHAAQESERHQVVTIKSEQSSILVLAVDDFSRPYLRLLTEGFSNVALSAPNPPALYFESLDVSRFEEPKYLDWLREWLGRKYVPRRLDLIVALGEDVVDFVAHKSGQPWPDVPVLYTDVESIRVDTRSDLPRAGGLLLEDHFSAALATIKTILPETTQVVLAYGASTVERVRTAGFADKVRAANLGLEPIVWAGLSAETMLAKAALLPPQSVVVLLAPYVDATGRVLVPGQLCTSLSATANVPAFTLESHDLGCGGVGGLVRDWTLVGRLLADQALARLTHQTTEVVTAPMARYTKLAFDARQLARWNIPERRLPAGSAILFREPNLWRDRRSLVITAIAVALAQTMLIVGLVLERRRRQRSELEGRRSLTTMAHLNRRAAMGELATSLAHELNQPLNAILQNAEAAQMMLRSASGPGSVDEVLDILDDIQKDDTRAGEVIRGMRALLQKHELEMKPLDVNAFARDTVALVLPDATSRGIQVDLELKDGLTLVHGDRIHLQQVLLNLLLNGLEAVTNMPPDRRHVCVRTSERNGSVELAVTDRGAGIAAHSLSQIFEAFYTTKGKGMGMGLSIARSIMTAHDGRLSAENNPEGGATVWFSLPPRARS
jgi:signal transduction histidine kinase